MCAQCERYSSILTHYVYMYTPTLTDKSPKGGVGSKRHQPNSSTNSDHASEFVGLETCPSKRNEGEVEQPSKRAKTVPEIVTFRHPGGAPSKVGVREEGRETINKNTIRIR